MANLRKEDGRSSSSNRSRAARSSERNRPEYTRDDKEAAALAVTGCGCIGALVLVKLAALVFAAWMLYLLISWVITK